jgi:CRP-like cAMP-binding protein
MSVLSGVPHSATVTSCTPSEVSVIGEAQFHRFLRRHPELAIEVAAMMADRLRWANQRRVDFAECSAKVRLARLLLDIAPRYGRRISTGVALTVGLSQPELASLAGVAEITLQKVLRELRSEKIILTGYRRLTVLDMIALQRTANIEV